MPVNGGIAMSFARSSVLLGLPVIASFLLLAAPAAAQHVEIRGGGPIVVPGNDPYGGQNPFLGSPYYYRGYGYEMYEESAPRRTTQYVSRVPQSTYTSAFYAASQASIPANAALVDVRIPKDAELWFSGEKTSQKGMDREFVTPELKKDRNHFYTLKARWMENGQMVEQSRRIQVTPGERVAVDFVHVRTAK
jgi:uncharacterized protein (TIGR03000 family)